MIMYRNSTFDLIGIYYYYAKNVSIAGVELMTWEAVSSSYVHYLTFRWK
jgi:hypothetical protein